LWYLSTLNFDNAGDNGAGADMTVEKEQMVGETPPH
jgi:hypothetical protein